MKKILPAVIGLGYVGLPIFLRLAKKFKCVGFDINEIRVKQLKNKFDINKEHSFSELKVNKQSIISSEISRLKKCNFFIITVPTPVYSNKTPDIRILKKVCKTLQRVIKDNDVVFFESTVFPGLTRFLKSI